MPSMGFVVVIVVVVVVDVCLFCLLVSKFFLEFPLNNQKSRTVSSWLMIGLNLYKEM